MSGERAKARTSLNHGRVGLATDPAVRIEQLRWQASAHRRTAIKRVDHCLAGLAALRHTVDDASLEAMYLGFRSVLAELKALDLSEGDPTAELRRILAGLMALQATLARFAAAVRKPEPDTAADPMMSARVLTTRP